MTGKKTGFRLRTLQGYQFVNPKFVLILFIEFWGCETSVESRSITNGRLREILDSLPEEVTAVYKYKEGYSVITATPAIKITALPGAIITDTLLQISPYEFRSARYSYIYKIHPGEVEELFLRKIVHPSSNWQGQTPGTDTVRTLYRRVYLRHRTE